MSSKEENNIKGKKNNRKNSSKRVSRRYDNPNPRNNGNSNFDNVSNSSRDTACNDPSWYIPTDQNLKDVASFSYNFPAGRDNGRFENLTQVEDSTLIWYKVRHANFVPGIASLKLIPAVGEAIDETSSVNIAAINMYSAIRRANSGAKNYDAPDLMSVVLAVGQVYSMMSWLYRLYGYCNVFSTQNTYLPQALVEANGVDYTSIMNNMSDFRGRLNRLALQVNAINVPKGLPIFDRWFHIYEKCYADSTTPQAQIYQAVPAGFFRRDDTTGELKLVDPLDMAAGELVTYEELIIFATDMVNALLYSEDVGTISGDVLKAFGDGGVYRLPIIPEDYSVIPTVSDEIRSQFENAVIIPFNRRDSHWSIQQDVTKAYLVATYTLMVPLHFGFLTNNKVLNFHKSDITEADTMVASRWVPFIGSCKYSADGKYIDTRIGSVGSEVAVGLTITSRGVNGTTGKIETTHLHLGSVINRSHVPAEFGADAANWVVPIAISASAFDWFPEITFVADAANPTPETDAIDNLRIYGSYLDYDRYYILDGRNIRDLNDTAIMGLFGMPNL